MKKFFGKLPVMITFIALAVIMAAAYIGLLVRPVAIGFTYKGEADVIGSMFPMFSGAEKQDVEMKFKGDYVRTTLEEDGEKYVIDMWIYRDGNYVCPIGIKELVDVNDDTKEAFEYFGITAMSEKDYKEEVKDWKEDAKEHPEEYKEFLKENAFEINAFTLEAYDAEFKCNGSVVFAIVGGIVELVLLAGATLSVIYFIKGKKA